MAHESFEDPEIAQIMNENFVNIKVDREERPDIDALYMDAVVAMSGSGGWPMSVFLTPSGEPFFGGTYFPPQPRHGLPSFRQILLGVAANWRERREQLLSTGEQLAEHLRSGPRLPAAPQLLDPDVLAAATEKLHDLYDWSHGGWGQAPKFPAASVIDFLLRRFHGEDDRHARDMALHALRAMAQGGIHDQLGGGFARYSVDRRWIVPHFEKMLYDNALLLGTYLRGWQVSGDDELRRVAERSFAFLQREMRLPQGGYASSLDADSEGEEGKYYVWTPEEIRQVLSGEFQSKLFMEAYGVTEGGNFEGRNILYRAAGDAELAEKVDLKEEKVADALSEARQALLSARQERSRPGLDDKVLTAWNGLVLSSLALGAQATGEATWLEAARSLAEFLLENLMVDGELKRSWRQGRARFRGYLEDHAALGLGLLDLYAADFDPRWYGAARDLAGAILERFQDPEGGFFDTPEDHEQLLARPKSLQDSPMPSGNTLAVALLLRLEALTGDERYWQPAERALGMMSGVMSQHPTAFAGWLNELDFALAATRQLALVGEPSADAFRALARRAHRRYEPNLVLAGGSSSSTDGPALLADRGLLNGEPAAYLCQGFVCKQPTSDPEELEDLLEAAP